MKSAIAVVLLALAAPALAESDPDAYAQLALQVAEPPFGMAVIGSDGVVADTTFITLSRRKPSRQSRQLIRMFKRADKQSVRLVVAGENSAKTAEVLRSALASLEGKSLPQLEIIFVGKPKHRDELQALTEGLGGTFYFADIDGETEPKAGAPELQEVS